MSYHLKIDSIKEALTRWAYLELKDMDERTTPEEIKNRRKYHLQVFNDFTDIVNAMWNGETDIHPEWLYFNVNKRVWKHKFGTSVGESKGGEHPKRAKVKGVKPQKGRK